MNIREVIQGIIKEVLAEASTSSVNGGGEFGGWQENPPNVRIRWNHNYVNIKKFRKYATAIVTRAVKSSGSGYVGYTAKAEPWRELDLMFNDWKEARAFAEALKLDEKKYGFQWIYFIEPEETFQEQEKRRTGVVFSFKQPSLREILPVARKYGCIGYSTSNSKWQPNYYLHFKTSAEAETFSKALKKMDGPMVEFVNTTVPPSEKDKTFNSF